jgi:YD repeat-containing protein
VRHHKDYSYDANGNRETESNEEEGDATRWVRDEANRLKTVVDPEEGESGYTYDPVGDDATLTDQDDRVTSYTYDPLSRLGDEQVAASACLVTQVSLGDWRHLSGQRLPVAAVERIEVWRRNPNRHSPRGRKGAGTVPVPQTGGRGIGQPLAAGFRAPGGRGMLIMLSFLACCGLFMLFGVASSLVALRSARPSHRPEPIGIGVPPPTRGQPAHRRGADAGRRELELRGRLGLQVFGSALLVMMGAMCAILVICYIRGRVRLRRASRRGPGALASGCG